MKGYWLNTEQVIHPELAKPCVKLGYCPYGQLVEEFPLYHTPEESKEWGVPDYPNLSYGDKLSCLEKNNNGIMQFGHDCPVHYHAEFFAYQLGRLE